jgi:hypothetical protein
MAEVVKSGKNNRMWISSSKLRVNVWTTFSALTAEKQVDFHQSAQLSHFLSVGSLSPEYTLRAF